MNVVNGAQQNINSKNVQRLYCAGSDCFDFESYYAMNSVN
jgi:hypothetical protein